LANWYSGILVILIHQPVETNQLEVIYYAALNNYRIYRIFIIVSVNIRYWVIYEKNNKVISLRD